MYSTDHNINNPLKTVDIDLLRTVPSWNIFKYETYSQEEYDLIQIHDPHTVYMIKDNNHNRMYIGDMLIEDKTDEIRYFLSIDKDKRYTIYMNTSYNREGTDLVPICTYDDPQVALNTLSIFNRVGSHIKPDLDMYNLFINYFDKDISTHEFITGILIIFGYKEDPRLQNVIQFIVGHHAHKCMKELPAFVSCQIDIKGNMFPDSLFPFYSSLYDLLVKYNFFTDKKYHTKDVDLNKEIADVNKIMIKPCLRDLL